ncbi:P-loop containing nucleoside triphosphate hydrolase protein [Microdochium trichocladiopsis]|uniref:P-loop containing nucleoside triphosphate hydrolase protein n=1 Tax=Microdochium trichocladiopsis TaxID=1682393 RepID=A0A9P8Y1C0_9PEZI|nr:P-loop containing nucleoside triphosphate hydrolase protein [Microdochium trichocladiopsis]KAH7027377.1 P-loop containing nucleoside triphosphate hydrolase protein [Microdochium trichocladiopsis]
MAAIGTDSWVSEASDKYGRYNSIRAKQTAPLVREVPGLKPGVSLHAHQAHAIGWIEQNAGLGGCVLADPPGFGKTLTALSLIARSGKLAVVVAPLSVCHQWADEVKKRFKQPRAGRAHEAKPVHKARYGISEGGGWSASEATEGGPAVWPLRQADETLGTYRSGWMIAPETSQTANFVNKSTSAAPMSIPGLKPEITLQPHQAHAVAWLLRAHRFHGGIIGDPPGYGETLPYCRRVHEDSQVHDSDYQVSRGHRHSGCYQTETDSSVLALHAAGCSVSWQVPRARRSTFCQEHEEPDFEAVQLLRTRFEECIMLTGTPLDNTWKDACALVCLLSGHPINGLDRYLTTFAGGLAKTPRGSHSRTAWGALIKAQQLAYHPALLNVMAKRRDNQGGRQNAENGFDHVGTDEDREEIATWITDIEESRTWSSSRVDAIIDTFHLHQERRTDDAVAIMGDSVCFLDILEIALRHSPFPVKVFRLDGRVDPALRALVLKEFEDAEGCRIMLTSRAVRGVGLNLQFANVLIQCGPWWKVAWQEQAIGRH